ncbi:probable terpene synthase 2 isoform X2 [Arachis hypogaea]|uniref:probable terpene synthase 2 isoform X2 n=1 Tax=Arachis hypogaea TaxID=3818 RepID=UPI003B227991
MSFLASVLVMPSTQHAPSNLKRPSVNFAPSIWHDTFLKYVDSKFLDVADDNTKQQAQKLREEVKVQLSSNNDILQKLNIIDSIQRLDISYHFEHEIEKAINQIYINFTNNNFVIPKEGGIHFYALLFRLLRQKGYQISSDIFNKFKNSEGRFKEIIAQDVKGIWSLYEAAQLRVHEEAILEEANDFTYTELKSITNQLSESLAVQINQSLKQPLHKAVPRIGTRSYMSFYEEDPYHNKSLLTFAKLDFNMLQKLHQNEVGDITKWWKNGEFSTKIPYARERVVEAYFWPLAISSDPNYSTARMLITKLTVCISFLDDTYDAYATLQELELFTQAIQRWDISPIKSLPECMKVVFNTILEVWKEIESVTSKDENSSLVLQHIKQEFFNLAQAYLVEAKWCHRGYIPTYDEYKVNGAISSTLPLQIIAFLGLAGFATKEVFDWVMSDTKIVKAVSLIGRLMDDMASHKVVILFQPMKYGHFAELLCLCVGHISDMILTDTRPTSVSVVSNPVLIKIKKFFSIHA